MGTLYFFMNKIRISFSIFLLTVLFSVFNTATAQDNTLPEIERSVLRSNVDSNVNNDKKVFLMRSEEMQNRHTSLKAGSVNAVSADAGDSLILVNLYNSTAGGNWTDNTNWLTDSVYKWKGITLNSSGKVTSIDLKENNLTGPLPAKLGGLSELQYLYLSDNALTGGIPAETGALSNLLALYLSGNRLTGNIPAEISGLTKLVWLGLGKNQLTGTIPDGITNLTDLEFIDLSQNDLTGSIPTGISNLTKLTGLFCEYNSLSGNIPSELGSITTLEFLALHNNNFTGPIPVELTNLTNLKQLYLHENELSGQVPKDLANLTKLEYFYLASNDLEGDLPDWFCNLTELKELALSHNAFSGQIPADIKNLQNLVILELNDVGLTGNIPVELSELPLLEGLFLADNQLEGTIPAVIGTLTNLKELWLSSNNLTGTVPAELNNLTNLYRLLLSENNLSALNDLSALPMDSAFYIQGNQLDFGDLETVNVTWDNIYEYSYSPQQNVPVSKEEADGNVTFSVDVAGTNNTYQWFKDASEISGETESSLTVKRNAGGEYYCEISNPDFPKLTLKSDEEDIVTYKITFTVTDGVDVIPGALVSLSDYGDVVTDENGVAVYENILPQEDIIYTVNASGYNTSLGAVTVVDSDVEEEVMMYLPTAVDQTQKAEVSIHPNPASEKVYIKSTASVTKVQIFNITGKLMLEKTSGMEGEIDISDLENGVYIMIIHTETEVITKKIIKK